MKTLVGGLIAVVLLGLYVYAVRMAVDVAGCIAAPDCTKLIAASFTEGMATAMSLVGGLVSALVISELSVTRPGSQPVARTVNVDPEAASSRAIGIVTTVYLLVWVAVGLWAYVVGVMQHPGVLQPLTDLGQSWLGLAIAAVYAYFGITPAAGGNRAPDAGGS